MYSPIMPACQEVPQAVITTRVIARSSAGDMLSPPRRAVPSSTIRRPRSVFRSDCGCSKISLSMKWAKPAFSIMSRSQSTVSTRLDTVSSRMVVVWIPAGVSVTISPSSRYTT